MANGYIPQIVSEFEDRAIGTMQVNLHKCPTCGRWMLPRIARHLNTPIDHTLFVISIFDTRPLSRLEQVLDRAGWRLESDSEFDNHHICAQCASEGKGGFTCALCGQVRSSDQEKKSFGDPAEFLCVVCYETQPAKVWQQKVDELYEEHRCDFE